MKYRSRYRSRRKTASTILGGRSAMKVRTGRDGYYRPYSNMDKDASSSSRRFKKQLF